MSMSICLLRFRKVVVSHRLFSTLYGQELIKIVTTLETSTSPSEKLFCLQSLHRLRDDKHRVNSATNSVASLGQVLYVAKDIITVMKHCDQSDESIEGNLADLLSDLVRRLDFGRVLILSKLMEGNRIEVYSKSWELVNNRLSLLLMEALEDNEDLDLNELTYAIHVLKLNGSIHQSCIFLIAQYLSDHQERFDLTKVLTLLYSMTKFGRDFLCNSSLLLSLQRRVLSLLDKCTQIDDRHLMWGDQYHVWLTLLLKLYKSFKVYDDKVMLAVSGLVTDGPYDPLIHSHFFLASLMKACSGITYMDCRLCDYVSEFFISTMNSATSTDIDQVLNAFAILNYNHLDFLDKVVDILPTLSANVNFIWSLMRSCLFHNRYYQQVVDLFLCDKVIEDKFRKNPGIGLYTAFLRILFSLTIENPDLDLMKYSPQVQGVYPFQIKGINDCHAIYCLEECWGSYSYKKRVPMNSDIFQTLQSITNGCIHTEAINLVGYTLDFELLVQNGMFYKVPFCLNYRGGLRTFIKINNDYSSYKSNNCFSKKKSHDVSPSDRDKKSKIPLATDWMRFFDSKSPSFKRICIEFDGPSHFSKNNKYHRLGHDVVKMRQLEAMGWHTIRISHNEWEDLKNGKERHAYINDKLWDVVNS